jgi:hypothetical protein
MRGEDLLAIGRGLRLQPLQHEPEAVARVACDRGEIAADAVGLVLGLRIESLRKQRLGDLLDAEVKLLELGLEVAHVATLARRDAAGPS